MHLTLFSLFVFLGAMRCLPVTFCALVWLLMLVSGSWGKYHFSLLITRKRLGGQAAGYSVQQPGFMLQALPRDSFFAT